MPDGFKSVLKPENSVIAGMATVGIVAGVYALDVGPVSQVHASAAYHGSNGSSIQKAGFTSLVMVAGITLLAKDPNIAILGGAAIIAFHLHYRHANMTNPDTGQVESPGAQAYQPAQATVPMAQQGTQ